MKFGGEIFVEDALGKITGIDPRLEPDYLLGEKRCYFRVGEDTSCRVEISGSAIRDSRLRRLAKSTGSRSKDMLWTTSSGIASQRRRSLSRAGRRRHFVTRSVQFIRHCLALTSRRSKQEQAGEDSMGEETEVPAGFCPCGIAPWMRVAGAGSLLVMKKQQKHTSHSPAQPQPMYEDPFYGHSEWVDAELKQAVAQENRREAQHSGKTIRRPRKVARTMGT